MTDFTPKTERVRDRYIAHSQLTSSRAFVAPEGYGGAFDRWLAKVKADALREAATSLIDWDVMHGHDVGTPEARESNRNASWLTAEADRIEREATA